MYSRACLSSMTTFLCQRLWKNSFIFTGLWVCVPEPVWAVWHLPWALRDLWWAVCCGRTPSSRHSSPARQDFYKLLCTFFFFLLLFHFLFFSLLAFVSLLKCFFYTVLFLPFSLLKLLKLGYFPFFSLFFFKFFWSRLFYCIYLLNIFLQSFL